MILTDKWHTFIESVITIYKKKTGVVFLSQQKFWDVFRKIRDLWWMHKICVWKELIIFFCLEPTLQEQRANNKWRTSGKQSNRRINGGRQNPFNGLLSQLQRPVFFPNLMLSASVLRALRKHSKLMSAQKFQKKKKSKNTIIYYCLIKQQLDIWFNLRLTLYPNSPN